MRAEFQESQLFCEVQIMRKLHHPFIIRLHEVIFKEDFLFLIMELIIGMDLLDTIVGKGGFDELGAKFVFYQLCSALKYVHEQGILHRDVKPENILLGGPSRKFSFGQVENVECVPIKITLVDFGLSKLQIPGEANSFVGTSRYLAPEVISVGEEEKRRQTGGTSLPPSALSMTSSPPHQARLVPSYSTPADCFAAGISLFVMLANCFPKFEHGIIVFEGKNERAATLSDEVKDLILQLTNPDPIKRLTMEQSLSHPWLAHAREMVESLIQSETTVAFDELANPSVPMRKTGVNSVVLVDVML